MHHASPIAQAVLLIYVPLVAVAFATLSRAQATATCILGAMLFLPEDIAFDPPVFPPLGKFSLSALVVYLAVVFGKKNAADKRSNTFFFLVVVMFVIGDLMTIATNREPIVAAPGLTIQGMGWGDAPSLIVSNALFTLLPFAIARHVFRDPASVVVFLKTMVAMGVFYALLMLVEVRLSPQMNVWVYGYHQHVFHQSIRAGGFRPLVFMAHGLATTLMAVMFVFAGVTLGKIKEKVLGVPAYFPALFIGLVLMVSNSMGSLIYVLFVTPVLWLGRPKLIAGIASVVAVLVLAVPSLRIAEMLPIDDLIELFAQIDHDRALSLQYRFDMEADLLVKGVEKPIFGFGGYGRERLYNAQGDNISVMDSAWIIAFAQRGYVGFFASFLILVLPIWLVRRPLKEILDDRVRIIFSGLTLMLVVMTFDLLMNGLFTYFPNVLAGALYGFSENLRGNPGVRLETSQS